MLKAFYHDNQCNKNSMGSGGFNDKKLIEIIKNTNSIIDFINRKQVGVSDNDIHQLRLAAK